MVADDRPTLLAHTRRMLSHHALRRQSSIPHSWRRHLAVPLSVYGLSSFTYVAVGLHALALWSSCPSAIPEWPPAIARPEACLVTLQGIWSFFSDVLNVGRDSAFHPIDRASALALVAVQLIKFGLVMPHSMTVAELVWIWFGLAGGIGRKLCGYRAILRGSPESFRTWHTLWHVSMPLFVGLLHSTRWRASCTAW